MGWLVVDESARDICYRNLMGSGAWARKARVYLEELYSFTSDILDRKFQRQAKDDLHGCFAEMYFAAVCRNQLSLRISHISDKGLDFYLDDLSCWVECVAPTHGDLDSENVVPVFENGICYQFPERQFLLRLSSVFWTKSKKVIDDIQKGLVLESQPVVIFVNAGAMHDRFSFNIHPPMFHVLLGLGSQNILLDRDTRSVVATEYEYRKFVEKTGTAAHIDIGYFFDGSYDHISAVIYSWADFANPRNRSDWGRDFFILHNPLAKNKLPYGFLPCGKEFYVDISSNAYSIIKYKKHGE